VDLDVVVAEGQTADAGSHSLHGGGTVSGKVLDSSGKPATRAVVRMFADNEQYESRTNQDGKYTIEHIKPGLYRLTATRSSGSGAGGDAFDQILDQQQSEKQVQVIEGQTINLDLDTRRLSEADWQALLSAELGYAVRVRFGRARHQVIRVERKRSGVVVHLSSFFSEAPDDVRDAIVSWMRAGNRARRATRTLDLWIDRRVRELAETAPLAPQLEPRGKVHDLAAIAHELRAGELAHAFTSALPWPAIGWGRAKGSRSRRSLRLGSYDAVARAVRIHPVLDSAHVERWFVRYVLFHELLHAVLDAPRNEHDARRLHHGPEFRRRERAYSDTARALDWEKLHVRALIRCAREARPFEPARRRATARAPRAKSWVQRLLF
jgi:hypothetical protein